MSAAVPTLRPLPAGVDYDRRDLDRHQPASPVTVREDGHVAYFVRTGRREIAVRDAAEQAMTIAYHNLRNRHSTATECDRVMRRES